MATMRSPEVREVNTITRTWSIGSQFLGHHEAGIASNNPSYSQTRGVIDIHNAIPQSHPHQYSANSPSVSRIGSTRSSSTAPAISISGSTNSQTQRPLLRSSSTFYDRIITDWWWWELLSLFISFACVAAIVGMLLFYNNRKQPQFVLPGITLNAYISVFATVSKAALILPVSEAIGQLKWIWFRDDASLWDFSLIDNASRGPWGSLVLLARTKCRYLVSLGAIVTVLALAFEPFFQQIVTNSERTVAVGKSTTRTATTYFEEKGLVTRSSSFQGGISDPPMIQTLQNAILMQNTTLKSAPSTCPTGNCTWPSFSTLGVSHECQDVSYLLEYVCIVGVDESILRPGELNEANDPCGWKVNNTFVVGTLDNDDLNVISLSTVVVDTFNSSNIFSPFLDSTSFSNVTLPLVDFYVAYMPGARDAVLRNDTPVMIECMMSWSIYTIKSTTSAGAFHETPILDLAIQPSPRANRSEIPELAITTVANQTFHISETPTRNLRDKIQADLPKSFDAVNSYGAFPGIWDFHRAPPYDINPYLINVTTSITNDLRSRSNGTHEIVGTAWGTEQFVQVRWEWFSLPLALLLASLVLVGWTVIKSKRNNAPAWKSSALATLVHGLSEQARERMDPEATPSQIEGIAQKLSVKLGPEGESARLMPV